MKPHLIVYACVLTFASGLAFVSVPNLLPNLGPPLGPRHTLAQLVAVPEDVADVATGASPRRAGTARRNTSEPKERIA